MKAEEAAFAGPSEWCSCEGNSRGKKGPEFTYLTLLYVVIWVWFFCNAQRSCGAGLQHAQSCGNPHTARISVNCSRTWLTLGERIGEEICNRDDDARDQYVLAAAYPDRFFLPRRRSRRSGGHQGSRRHQPFPGRIHRSRAQGGR